MAPISNTCCLFSKCPRSATAGAALGLKSFLDFLSVFAVQTPTLAEVRRALRGPVVPWRMKGCEHVMLCDVRSGSSARIVSVLAVAFEHREVSWAKRIFMTPIDDEVIALQSAGGRN